MCIGEHRKLVIPPDLAFGSTGVPPLVPEDSTLIFYVELIDIERRSELWHEVQDGGGEMIIVLLKGT